MWMKLKGFFRKCLIMNGLCVYVAGVVICIGSPVPSSVVPKRIRRPLIVRGHRAAEDPLHSCVMYPLYSQLNLRTSKLGLRTS